MADWQKIETAPKDRTPILVFFPRTAWNVQPRYVVGWHGADGLWLSMGDGGGYCDRDYGPTHWMPLPNPPSASQS